METLAEAAYTYAESKGKGAIYQQYLYEAFIAGAIYAAQDNSQEGGIYIEILKAKGTFIARMNTHGVVADGATLRETLAGLSTIYEIKNKLL